MRIQHLFLGLIALSISGCGDAISGKDVAEPEVVRFHESLKRRDFERMYAATGKEYQVARPRGKGRCPLYSDRQEAGLVARNQTDKLECEYTQFRHTVVLVYLSRFESGEATETFTFRVQNGTPELIGYNIASLDMLIK